MSYLNDPDYYYESSRMDDLAASHREEREACVEESTEEMVEGLKALMDHDFGSSPSEDIPVCAEMAEVIRVGMDYPSNTVVVLDETTEEYGRAREYRVEIRGYSKRKGASLSIHFWANRHGLTSFRIEAKGAKADRLCADTDKPSDLGRIVRRFCL